MTVAWNEKMLGEEMPPSLDPKTIVDIKGSLGHIFSKIPAHAVKWPLIRFWRIHARPTPKPDLDEMAESVGLTRKDTPYAQRLRQEVKILEEALDELLAKMARTMSKKEAKEILRKTRKRLDDYRAGRLENTDGK